MIALKQDFFENILDVTALDQNAALSILTDYGTMHFGDSDAWKAVQDNREYLMNHECSDGEVQSNILDGYYFMSQPI